MAKKTKSTVMQVPTPEALASDEWEVIDPAKVDSSEHRIGAAMRRRGVSLIDRWHKAGTLDQAQVHACERYRRLHVQAFGGTSSLTRAGIGRDEDAGERAASARHELGRAALVIGRDTGLWELVVLEDRYTSVDPSTLSDHADAWAS